MKLFQCSVQDDMDESNFLIVAENLENAKQKVLSMDWDCYMFSSVKEIDIVNGYEITVGEKVGD